jgi:hypothetical protein
MKKFILPALSVFLLMACGKTETAKINITATFSSEGPFMEGVPESFQHEVGDAFDVELKKLGFSADMLKSVKLKTATAKTADSSGFDDFSSCTLSMLSGGKEKAKTIAVKNPLEKGQKSVSLQVSADVDLAEHLKSKDKFLVMDLNALKDRENPFAAEMGMEFEVEIKK